MLLCFGPCITLLDSFLLPLINMCIYMVYTYQCVQGAPDGFLIVLHCFTCPARVSEVVGVVVVDLGIVWYSGQARPVCMHGFVRMYIYM